MTKTFALVNLAHKEIARKRGKVILHNGPQPPCDLPPGYRRDRGYSWEIVEDEISRQHVGEPEYFLADSQCGRVTRRLAPKE